ncbi:hypothetical protein V494_05909 [Pseudogymnoascus sp. VKM F-4513 (FW-928)]|nr:hypothetical protein V494_05909 [Pseudogymnoascus sp. VKM F-4513 (FW-928)]
MAWQDQATAVSSIGLRLAAYVFLRWIPTPVCPPIIYTLFALYIPSFVASYLGQSPYEVIADEIDVKVNNTEGEERPESYADAVKASPDSDEEGDTTAAQENLELEETIILEKKSPKFWKTLLTGLPSPTSRFISIATFLINLGLVLAATDLIYRAKSQYPSNDLSFARIGYVSDSEAKLLVREPDRANLPIYVSVRDVDSETGLSDSSWRSYGPITNLSNDTDYTSAISIPLPRTAGRTKYQYVTSNNHKGFITSAPKTGYTNDHDGKFTFLTSSCIIPRFPYNPFKHPLSIPGFKHLAKVLPSLDAQFMLFLGDFIYIDVPKRFGYDVESYRRNYRQVYASPDWPSVGQNLSWIHVIDDHEITNDFDLNTEHQEASVYQTAIEPWNNYQGAVNPPVARKSSIYNKDRSDTSYFEFTQGPATFFMMDTRRYRDLNGGLPANDTGKSMLGNEQLQDLLAFLARPVPRGVRWKFVVSSVPFTKNWKVNSLDTWAGFLDERQKILEAMWDVGLRGGVGVVVLSGDRHEFAATAFPPPLGGKWPVSATVHEFSTSPLSQFYLPIPSYRQTDDEDVLVKYIPDGNSKFGSVTIESPQASEQSILKFRLFVNGEEEWDSILLSPPMLKGKGRSKDVLWAKLNTTMSTQADLGAKALAAKDYTSAIKYYTEALKTANSPLWFTNRSTAYHRAGQFDLALQDAESGVLAARQRARREQITAAQLRRAIALYSLGRLGDARLVLTWVRKLNEKEKSLGVWQLKVANEYEKLPEDAEGRKITVTEVPDEAKLPEVGKTVVTEEKGKTVTQVPQTSNPAQTPKEKIRHEWYQSSNKVTITIFAKGIPKEQAEVKIAEDSIEVNFPIGANSSYSYSLDNLYERISPSESTFSITPNKLEITLHKTSGTKWPALESATRVPAPTTKADSKDIAPPISTTATGKGPSYPTSSKHGPKNWDALASSALAAESTGDNKLGGDDDDEGDPLHGFFKKLYKDADPDTKKAMMKSYTESNGTALSTNWADVKKKPVETNPPEGVEAKSWGK